MAIYFTYSNVYISVLLSQFVPPEVLLNVSPCAGLLDYRGDQTIEPTLREFTNTERQPEYTRYSWWYRWTQTRSITPGPRVRAGVGNTMKDFKNITPVLSLEGGAVLGRSPLISA